MAYRTEKKNTASDLKEKLKLSPSGTYFFFGEEEYLKEYYAGEVKKLLDKDMADLNYNRIYAGDVSKQTFEDIIDDLSVPPIMSDYRVTLVRGLEVLKLREGDIHLLEKLVETATGGNILIILCSADEYVIDSKTRYGKIPAYLKENTFYMECEKQSEAKLLPWVDRHFGAEGIRIADINSRRLISLCNGNMTVLDSEIKKLCAYCKREKTDEVTRRLIDDMVSDRAEFDLYDMGNCIMSSDKAAAMRIYYSLKRRQTPVMVILSGIERAISNSMILESAASERISPDRVEKATGMKTWQQQKVYRGKIPQKTYAAAMEICLECDIKLKSTKTDEDVVCETMIIKLLELFSPGK
ncbi:MAG: DNA polymerase III subunit delta [Clostridia bacterium]|nr:DNA polymerase III subunit delta [Clostridia bacterium]